MHLGDINMKKPLPLGPESLAEEMGFSRLAADQQAHRLKGGRGVIKRSGVYEGPTECERPALPTPECAH